MTSRSPSHYSGSLGPRVGLRACLGKHRLPQQDLSLPVHRPRNAFEVLSAHGGLHGGAGDWVQPGSPGHPELQSRQSLAGGCELATSPAASFCQPSLRHSRRQESGSLRCSAMKVDAAVSVDDRANAGKASSGAMPQLLRACCYQWCRACLEC
jgi:hypothetical protein